MLPGPVTLLCGYLYACTPKAIKLALAVRPALVRCTRSLPYIARTAASGLEAQSIKVQFVSLAHQPLAVLFQIPGFLDEVSFFTLTTKSGLSPISVRALLRLATIPAGLNSPASLVPSAITTASGSAFVWRRFKRTSRPSRRHALLDGCLRMTSRPVASRHCHPKRSALEPTASIWTVIPTARSFSAYSLGDAETRLSPTTTTDATPTVSVS